MQAQWIDTLGCTSPNEVLFFFCWAWALSLSLYLSFLRFFALLGTLFPVPPLSSIPLSTLIWVQKLHGIVLMAFLEDYLFGTSKSHLDRQRESHYAKQAMPNSGLDTWEIYFPCIHHIGKELHHVPLSFFGTSKSDLGTFILAILGNSHYVGYNVWWSPSNCSFVFTTPLNVICQSGFGPMWVQYKW